MATPYYDDGQVTLYLGDCREVTEWLDADVLVTDPPYGIGWEKPEVAARPGGGRSRPHDGIQNDRTTEARDSAVSAWGDRPAVVFGSLKIPITPTPRHVLVWEKPSDAGFFGSTTGFRQDVEGVYLLGTWPKVPIHSGSVLRSQTLKVGGTHSPAGRTGHPHAKPLDVMEALVLACPPGVIADPFAGSGSTLIAARNLGRRAIGVELDERYAEICANRLAQDCLDLGGI